MILEGNYISIPFVENTDIDNFDWHEYIDKVYIMSIPKNKHKTNIVHNELNRIGIDNMYIQDVYNINNPLYQYIFKSINTNQDYNKQTERDFNILLNHYEIIKKSYEFGYTKIMICEDDIRFLKNDDLIKQQIKQLNFNTIDWLWLHKGQLTLIGDNYKINMIVSSACYILNQKAMKSYIDFIENRLLSISSWAPNDVLHIFITKCNKYFLENDICICNIDNNNSTDYQYTHIISDAISCVNKYKEEDYNLI